jgi:hypothetical protein
MVHKIRQKRDRLRYKSIQEKPISNAAGQKKKARTMKNSVFLMVPAMAILLSGCTSTPGRLQSITGSSQALIHSNTSLPSNSQVDRGWHLSISARSSVNIDVSGIVDYIQGDEPYDSNTVRQDGMHPWVSLNLSY